MKKKLKRNKSFSGKKKHTWESRCLWVKLFSFILFLFFSGNLLAQGKTIKGRVMDIGGDTLTGVSIVVKGTTIGTSTDLSGNYKLDVPDSNAILVFSFISYLTQEVSVKDRDTINVTMQPDSKQLGEVVVTALGIQKDKSKLGYAIQTIDSKSLTRVQDPNLINNISGKVAGVFITNGGAGVGSTSRIVIRGENSFSGSNQPLFVVDGVPINNETFFNDAIENSSSQGTWAEVDWGNGAAEINSHDIEKVTVLKGPAAAALYGTRASNGAVVLTTKKGTSKIGKIGINYNTMVLFDTPLRLPHLQNQYGAGVNAYPLSGSANTYQYVNGAGSSENNIANWGLAFNPSLKVRQFDSPVPGTDLQAADLAPLAGMGLTSAAATPTPWVGHSDHFQKFLQTGITFQQNVAFSSVTKNGNYRFSVGNMNNKGILPNTDMNRYTVTFRQEHRFTEKLTSNIFMNFINSGSDNRPNIGYGSESVMYTFFGVYGMPINVDINSLKKQWESGLDQQAQFRYWANHDNPYVTMFDNTNSFNKNRLIGNASLKYEISPQFNVMARTGSDFYNDAREGHRAFGTVRFPTGGFRTDNVNYFENNTDFLFNYIKPTAGDFNMTASIGANRFIQNVTYTRDIANSLISPELYNYSNSATRLPTLFEKFNKEIYSAYAFADFDYKKYLFLNVTGRNDITSTLPPGNNSYFYPSASLSYVPYNMFNLPKAFSFLKVRGSLAKVGRDANPYSVNNTYLTNTPFNNYNLTTGNNVLANINLKPSSTVTQELGLEMAFFKNRIDLNVTVYNSNTTNEVVQLPIPVSSGYTNAYVNGASINNKGIEAMLMINPVRSQKQGGFNWDMVFNFSLNRGYVTALPDGLQSYTYAQITQYDRYYRAIQYVAKVGERLGDMYGNSFLRDPNGNIIYKNGLPQYTTTQNSLLGNYNPNFVLTWNNNLSWKNFDLSFLWDWHQGGKFYSYTELGVLAGGMSTQTLDGRQDGIVGKGVMLDANGNYVPNNVRVSAADYYNAYYNATNNEACMYDASYLKLRQVKLGYTFKKVFGGESQSNLTVAFVGRNLFLLTKNKDVDPETLALRGQSILPGVEFLSLPSTKSMGVSLNLTF